jgi:chitin deacetylase
MNRILLFIVISAIFLILIAYGLFRVSKLRNFQFFGGLTSRVETNKKVVALTFDDAPTEQINEVLKILKDNDVKATFYMIGENIEKYPTEAKAIVHDGHEMGNHSYSHQRFLLKSYGFIDEEIQNTNTLIRNLGYKGNITFRPPNGKKLLLLPWYLKQHNIQTIMWDVEPDTYIPGDAKAIEKYTIENVKPGSIILIHPLCNEDCKADREALPTIIQELKKKGYKFVSVSELLNY